MALAFGMTSPGALVINRHSVAAQFHAAAVDLLSREEALNNLLLGISHSLAKGRVFGSESPMLLTLEVGGSVVGAAIRTPPYPLLLSRVETGHIGQLAAWLREHDGLLPGVNAEVAVAHHFADAYLPTGVEPRVESKMRLFELLQLTKVEHPPGSIRLAVESDAELVRAWYADFEREALPNEPSKVSVADNQLRAGQVWLWIDADRRPVCMAVRNRELPTGASIGPVYTPPTFRFHGYATALVAEVSRNILGEGKRYVCLFTDLSNPTSNSIYPKVGYRRVADMVNLCFPG